ncbi:hypothetical protein GUJ93_ZPchr0004g38967 [Zizania palustris]|uniref:Uncharacterized protein n=1 Tax=Zizania palustris TaxID=103762 RepID=A0A8J5S0R6_ZIZPA|nr:hypothetical protein GUJ93_ZPchr0004g38967 [Zizania palustris]
MAQRALGADQERTGAPGAGHPLARGRQGTDDSEEDPNNNFVATAHKLEFPKFDGTNDPLPWLNRCERYFHVCQIPDHKGVTFVAFYLLDELFTSGHKLQCKYIFVIEVGDDGEDDDSAARGQAPFSRGRNVMGRKQQAGAG